MKKLLLLFLLSGTMSVAMEQPYPEEGTSAEEQAKVQLVADYLGYLQGVKDDFEKDAGDVLNLFHAQAPRPKIATALYLFFHSQLMQELRKHSEAFVALLQEEFLGESFNMPLFLETKELRKEIVNTFNDFASRVGSLDFMSKSLPGDPKGEIPPKPGTTYSYPFWNYIGTPLTKTIFAAQHRYVQVRKTMMQE